jgi:hypothetical protein
VFREPVVGVASHQHLEQTPTKSIQLVRRQSLTMPQQSRHEADGGEDFLSHSHT